MRLPEHDDVVRPEWIDANGHMNLAYYIVVFDHALDDVFDALDIGMAYRQRTGNSSFVVETHTLYAREATVGERVRVRTRVLGTDAKRLHLFQEMVRAKGDELLATQEQMCVHVDMVTRRSAAWPPDRQEVLRAMVQAQAGLPVPPGAGRRIAMPR